MGLRAVRVDTSRCELLDTSWVTLMLTTRCASQVLCVIPVPLVRWILVGVAFCVSGYFLVANVYPVLASVSHLVPYITAGY